MFVCLLSFLFFSLLSLQFNLHINHFLFQNPLLMLLLLLLARFYSIRYRFCSGLFFFFFLLVICVLFSRFVLRIVLCCFTTPNVWGYLDRMHEKIEQRPRRWHIIYAMYIMRFNVWNTVRFNLIVSISWFDFWNYFSHKMCFFLYITPLVVFFRFLWYFVTYIKRALHFHYHT